jgi:hypothetical protein
MGESPGRIHPSRERGLPDRHRWHSFGVRSSFPRSGLATTAAVCAQKPRPPPHAPLVVWRSLRPATLCRCGALDGLGKPLPNGCGFAASLKARHGFLKGQKLGKVCARFLNHAHQKAPLEGSRKRGVPEGYSGGRLRIPIADETETQPRKGASGLFIKGKERPIA